MSTVAADQNRGAAVGPIKIEKRKKSRVELRVGLLELVASTMRAHHLPARHLVRPIVFHTAPKPLKEPHRRSFLAGKDVAPTARQRQISLGAQKGNLRLFYPPLIYLYRPANLHRREHIQANHQVDTLIRGTAPQA